MQLSQDFREFLRSLNDNGVRYLIVGGYAVAWHGHPRYTKDLDVWIERTDENAANIVGAIEQFGFASLQLRTDDFLEADQIIQIGLPPNRIDLITSIAGVEFDECYPHRMSGELEDVTVPFIDIVNLKKNKQASGRLQDLADLENLG